MKSRAKMPLIAWYCPVARPAPPTIAGPRARGLRQRGAAILTAMLTVTLVAALASAAMWQQWRSVELESAERTRSQMAWVLTGALDWARLILREDGLTSRVDHLSEPWALPLAEARLSSFLAVDENNTDIAMDAFLSGQMTDQQGLLNISNLVLESKRSEADYQAFVRLFKTLQLPQAQLDDLVAQLLSTSTAGSAGSMVGAFMPTRLEQLGWLGVPSATVQALVPYVTLLPGRTTVNLNTATAPVLMAVLPGLAAGAAQQMVQARSMGHYATVADALKAAGVTSNVVDSTMLGIASRYFAVRGQLRIGDTMVQELSLIDRQGTNTVVLWRRRESLQTAVAGS